MTRRILSTIVFIVDPRRNCIVLRDTSRQQIDSETRRRAVVIVTREQSISVYFFLNCPTIISIPCTRLKRSHEVTNHYRVARFSPPPFYPSPFRSISSLSFFFFPPLPSSLIESTLRSVNPSYYSGTHRKLCSLLLRNIAEGNICVLISLAPQGYSRKLRRQAINHKSLTARKETRKGSFPPSRTSFFFPPNL